MADGDIDWSAYFEDLAERFDDAINDAMKQQNRFPDPIFTSVAGHSLHASHGFDPDEIAVVHSDDRYDSIWMAMRYLTDQSLLPSWAQAGAYIDPAGQHASTIFVEPDCELRGVSRLDNPHKPGTVPHRDWESRWVADNGVGSETYRQAKAIADQRLDRLRDSLAPTPEQAACRAIMDEVADALRPDSPTPKITSKTTATRFRRLPDLDTMQGSTPAAMIFDEIIDFQFEEFEDPFQVYEPWHIRPFTTPRGPINFITMPTA